MMNFTKEARTWLSEFNRKAIADYMESWDAKIYGGPLTRQGAQELAEQEMEEIKESVENMQTEARRLRCWGMPDDMIAGLITRAAMGKR